jgi:hypothetical protein
LIKAKRLDDYDFSDVDLIKVDVEGHEESVLAGGMRTIEINRPVLIVEIEQRHIKKPIEEVSEKCYHLAMTGFICRMARSRALTVLHTLFIKSHFSQMSWIGDM